MGCSASITTVSLTATKIITGSAEPNAIASDPVQRNAEIDLELQKYKNQMKKVIKILLLGAGESGKSTILNQLRYVKIIDSKIY